MSSRLHMTLATTALALMFSANPVTARAQQKPVTADQAQIVDTVSTIYSREARGFAATVSRANGIWLTG
jgi:hypothetical protein